MRINVMSTDKLLVVLLSLIGLVFAQSKEADQAVFNWPDGYDAIGAHWWLFNYTKGAETHWQNESTPGSGIDDYMRDYDLIWNYGELGHFNAGINSWSDGDLCIWFGSWDSAYAADPATYGSNPGHTGYFWFSSNNVIGPEDPWYWPHENAQIMPKPAASHAPIGYEPGTVYIEIDNPTETGVPPKEYDVLGYWIVANAESSGPASGAPDDFTYTIGFAPVMGGPSDITFFKYRFYDIFEPGYWNLYHAYYIVFRPDTTSTDEDVIPGYSTTWMSQHSNQIFVPGIGIYEGEATKPVRFSVRAEPTIFTQCTRLSYALPKKTRVTLAVYNASGRLISTLCDEIKPAGRYTVEFNAETLPNGVCFLKFHAGDYSAIEKLLLIR